MPAERRKCIGGNTIPREGTFERGFCGLCGTDLRIRNDGTLPEHQLRYERFLAEMAAAVERLVGWRGFGSHLGASQSPAPGGPPSPT
ncbi:hypothetical protein B7435_30075 [Mycolicibacterium peregrinum]|uniref:Uncharacterized protein n=1 Tax=Mycolicibacterium alvei TaxID=67081 RepID=A0A6N4V2I6_9MYCO|nr:hypothetical protein B7435_30075 [Mycolicibacterium peregrinum]BBX30505.1 hypothetical protein MALV_56300 [Mycolicibacterium alvei]